MTTPDVPLFDFNEFNHLISLPEVWEREEKWGKRADKG